MTTYKKLLKNRAGDTIIPVTDGDVEIVGTTTGDNFSYAWKFLDGRLICFQRYKYTGNMASTWGSVYAGNLVTPKNYAVPFVALPVVSATVMHTTGSNANCWLCTCDEAGLASTTKPGGYQLVRPTSASNTNGYIDIVAYGFWK